MRDLKVQYYFDALMVPYGESPLSPTLKISKSSVNSLAFECLLFQRYYNFETNVLGLLHLDLEPE